MFEAFAAAGAAAEPALYSDAFVDEVRSQFPCSGTQTSSSGGAKNGASERYVLCEINVSSVVPFPESAIAPWVEATRKALAA